MMLKCIQAENHRFRWFQPREVSKHLELRSHGGGARTAQEKYNHMSHGDHLKLFT